MKNIAKTAWIMLVIGFITYTFSSGRWNIDIAAWIWPFALLYFSRQTANKKQFLILAAVLAAGHIIKWLDILGGGYLFNAALCLIWSVCWIIPFLADRLLAQKLSGVVLSSLIFPSVFVTMEFLRGLTLVSSIGVMAYTQEGFLPLVQITSVIGSYGLSFLILWFGTIVVTAIEKRAGWKKLASVYLAIMIVVFGFGVIRLAAFPVDESNTVNIASIVGPFYGHVGEGDYIRIPYEDSKAYFLSEVKRAANGGAEIACWNEESFAMKDVKEEQFIDMAKAQAAEYDMILLFGLEIEDTDNSEGGLWVNKSVIIQPDGTTTVYIKTKLVPIIETSEYKKGTGDIPTVVTDKGILSTVICFDDSYISYVHGMGANTNGHFRDTEVLFVPSWDWYSVKQVHTKLAEFRAVENGHALVKPTHDGISTAVDYQGHVIKRFDTAKTGFDTVQFAKVPVTGVHTIYSEIGTLLDMMACLAGFVMVALGIYFLRRKQ